MVQIWMSEDFAEEWVFELELVLVSSLVLVEVVDVEETKYGSYQKGYLGSYVQEEKDGQKG